MEEKIALIKRWLGTGSINILGLPFSGKDTMGEKLAELLGGQFMSSGAVIRRLDSKNELAASHDKGLLTPTDHFREVILPALFAEAELNKPLILSSVGRWIGEEKVLLELARQNGHPVKAAVLLNISENEAEKRWEACQTVREVAPGFGERSAQKSRHERFDDKSPEVLRTRFREFVDKTLPVVWAYHNLGLIIHVNANQSREGVVNEAIDKLAGVARAYFAKLEEEKKERG